MNTLLRRWRARLGGDQRGDGDVAAMIMIVPLAFGAVLLFVHVGRQGVAVNEVSHAAGVAARAASLERSAGDAQAAAANAAAVTLADAGLSCSGGPAVSIAASSWEPGGVVTVTVTCTTGGIADIGATGRTLTASARSTIDQFRSYR